MARNPDSSLYNKIHETYDNLKFQKKPCERLVVYAGIGKGQRVLDVACGTGWATLDAARAVGQTGRVFGIDIADKALEIARGKAHQTGLNNIRFEQQDGHRLKFEDCAFDVVICASALFGFDDIPGALREWHRVLRPGGRAAFSSFGPEFRTVSTMLRKTIAKYDKGSSPMNRNEGWLDTIDKCVSQLADTGFDIIQTTTEELGYYYLDLNAYWQEVMSSMRRIHLDRLDPATLGRVREEHLEEMKAFAGGQGIWRPVPTIFAVGLKPS
jgi:ubiquinone/menaquinone biosynthesis C-methylase UbiE